MFILKKGHQPGVYVPLRALFLVILNFGKIPRQIMELAALGHLKINALCCEHSSYFIFD